MNWLIAKRFISRRQLVVIFILSIAACVPAWGKDTQILNKTEAIAEQVEKDAECEERKEGKQDLVADEIRVKVDKSGAPVIEQKGEASFYGRGFHGKKTASGEKFSRHEETAAHRTLPLGSEAEVTNLETGKSIEVEINDRGPYVKGRDLDLSKKAAREIGLKKEGIAPVKIEAKIPPGAEVQKGGKKCPER